MIEGEGGSPPPAKLPSKPVIHPEVKGRAIGLTPSQTKDVIAAVSNTDTFTLTPGQMKDLLKKYPRGTTFAKILADIAAGKTIVSPSEIAPLEKK